MSRFGFENQRSVICKVVLAVTVILSVFLIVACKQEPEVPEVELGSIVGHVFYSNGEDHSGIVLTLDKTDGLRAITNNDGARAIVSMAESNEDGSFAFHNLEPGTYTIYASSNDSVEKAVSTNVVVRGADAVTAEDLHLTATGSISGNVIMDGSKTGNLGFLVFLAGTSYMAVTDDSGYYCISNVPAGEGYQLIVSKGGYTSSTVKSCSVKAHTRTSMSEIALLSDDILSGSRSLVWKGSLPTAPADPKLFWGYFDTTDGCSYIFDGTKWTLLAAKGDTGATGAKGEQGDTGAAGEDGASIIWLGSFASEPQNPARLNAYYNTETGSSYIFDGTKWTLLAVKGDTGATGAQGEQGDTGAAGAAGEDGASIVWRGEFGDASEIENVAALNAYFNTTDGCSYIYDGTKWTLLAVKGDTGATGAQGKQGDTGAAGEDGASIVWRGEFGDASEIENAVALNAYFNTTDGCSYIFDGTKWTLLAAKGDQGPQGEQGPQGGTGAAGADGVSIIWRGSYADASEIENAVALNAYFNITDGISYIYDGTQWNVLAMLLQRYRVTFDPNGGRGKMDGLVITSDEKSAVLPRGTFTGDSGAQFVGWNSKADYTGDIYLDTETITPSGDITLYAQWVPEDTFTVSEGVLQRGSGFDETALPAKLAVPAYIGDAEVTGIGSEVFYTCFNLTDISIPSTVTSIGENSFCGCENLECFTIPSSVESIGAGAFGYCHSLESITIPSSITSIVESAFQNCSGLESIIIPSSVESIGDFAFFGCENLESITIPSSVTSIGDFAFVGCTNLGSITIPSSVTSIGYGAFQGCNPSEFINNSEIAVDFIFTSESYEKLGSPADLIVPAHFSSIKDETFSFCDSLESVAFEEGSKLTSIGKNVFSYCTGLKSITLPSSLTSIGDSAFAGCTNLGSITIPSSVTSIGESAFAYCTGLTSIIIPDSVISIGDSAFKGCTSLSSVTLPKKLKSIGNEMLYECTGLGSITIPDTVETIGYSAFDYCSSLTSVSIPDSVISIGERAFAYCTGLTGIILPSKLESIADSLFSGCTSLGNITIPSSVTAIGTCAFSQSGLMSITIPDGIETIDSSAFTECVSLKTVSLPTSVTTIGSWAFYGCTSLESVTIPNSVTSIGQYAFYKCRSLASITIPSSVTSIGSDAFNCCNPAVFVNNSGVSFDYSFTKDVYKALGSPKGDLKISSIYSSIGFNVFTNNTDLTGITIPASVKNIASKAFMGCTELASVVFEEGAQLNNIHEDAFNGCSKLTSITIPATTIESRVFSNCTSLTSVTFSASVKYIWSYAFNSCSSLESVSFAEGTKLISIGNNAFENCYNLDSVNLEKCPELNKIGASAFSGCSELASITIPASVTSIGTDAFKGCYPSVFVNNSQVSLNYEFGKEDFNKLQTLAGTTITELSISPLYSKIGDITFLQNENLTSVTIPASVKTIGSNAFNGCSNLRTVTFSAGSELTEIGGYAFYSCTSLESITIPDSVETINQWAFEGCTSLESITLSNRLTVIPYACFYSCTKLESITIPASVTNIYEEAFKSCSSLQSVTFCNDSLLTEIGGDAFNGCSSLQTVAIPEGVTNIKYRGFKDCTSLTSVTLPVSVTSFGDDLFRNCSNLATLTYLGTETQWKSVTKNSGWNSGVSQSFQIIYNPPLS